MASRLSVVMVHSPPASAPAQKLAEEAVGELIGLPGLDLTLVGPLAHLSATSTDRLTLESLGGDMAVLDWQTPAEIIQALLDLGCVGNRTPHPDDPQASPPSGPGRRIYAFDLNQFRDGKSLCASVTELKSSRQVRTFSLPLGPSTSTKKTIPPSRPANSLPGGDSPLSPRDGSLGGQPATTLDLDDLLDKLDELDP